MLNLQIESVKIYITIIHFRRENMLKKFIIPVMSVTGLALLSGCATEPTTYPKFTAAPVAQPTSAAQFKQKTDTVFVILDSSSSMNATYQGSSTGDSKLDVEKQFLYRLKKTIPANMSLSTGVQTFGSGHCVGWSSTKMDEQISSFSSAKFQESLDKAECASGGSPLNSALEQAATDLDSARGNIAVLILSDGQQVPANTMTKAQELKDKFGSRLCIYTVWVGNDYDADGQFVLQELTNISQCGRSADVAELNSSASVAHFTEHMLYTQTAVAAAPTSNDSDGDGVINSKDKCANTPVGAKVNSQGCWSYNSVDFGFDSTTIPASSKPLFDNAIYTLKRNSNLKVQLEGHTDSTGPEAYNQGLSERRAEAVKKHLVESGIDASRLTTVGYGESNPISPNDTAKGRTENRRVGFSITAR